jgi:HEAT repeat protein
MSNPFQCPNCQFILGSNYTPGRVVRCPNCRESSTVPGGGGSNTPTQNKRHSNPDIDHTPKKRPAPVAAPADDDSSSGNVLGWAIVILLMIVATGTGVAYLLLPQGLYADPSASAAAEQKQLAQDAPKRPRVAGLDRLIEETLPIREMQEQDDTWQPVPEREPLRVKEPVAKTEVAKKAESETKTASEEEQPTKKPKAPHVFKLTRRHNFDEEQLRKQLELVPEVTLGADTGVVWNMAKAMQDRGIPYPGPGGLNLTRRPDLAGLPIAIGQDTQLGVEPAKNLQDLSRLLRIKIEQAIPSGQSRVDVDRLRSILKTDGRGEWLKAAAVPVLMQMLQAESKEVRGLLVELLGEINGKEASRGLAYRAMTDLCPEVREQACRQLNKRPREEFRDLLLAGLNYPWHSLADHAAECISAIGMEEAVPKLVEMLEQPDVSMPVKLPVGKGSKMMIREMVRMNHMANCIFCHEPSASRGDLVRAAVPLPGEDPPPPATTPQYYERGTHFVRADVTYLRQDFSVVQPVKNNGKWPSHQRYDYVVRMRPMTTKEQEKWEQIRQEKKTEEDHRKRISFVLRELTGKDLGRTARDWQPVLPKSMREPESPGKIERVVTTGKDDWKKFLPARENLGRVTTDPERLKERLTKTPTEKQGPIIEAMRVGRQPEYTFALGETIPGLKGEMRDKAQAALVERLLTMSGAELLKQLQSDLPAIRAAAAMACAEQGDKRKISSLIPLIGDKDNDVVVAAREALRKLTGQAFGPKVGPSGKIEEETKAKAAQEWETWWKKQTQQEI